MLLATKKNGEYAYNFGLVIDVKVKDGAIFGDVPNTFTQMWSARPLVRDLY